MEDPDEDELEDDWMMRLDDRSFWRRATRSDGVSVSGIDGREDEDVDSRGWEASEDEDERVELRDERRGREEFDGTVVESLDTET